MGLTLGLLALPAQAVDLAPLDGIAPPAGVKVISLAARHSHSDRAYRDGEHQPQDLNLDLNQLLLRGGASFQLAGKPSYFYAELPIRDFQTGGQLAAVDSGSGIGDLSLALAHWPLADHERGRYIGIAGYLTLPTGEYDAKRTRPFNLNPGGNRFAAALQTGLTLRLTPTLHWAAAVDLAVFGHNDDYLGRSPTVGTLEQRPLWTLQSGLGLRIHPKVSLGVSYYYNQGGETRSHGGEWSSKIDLHRTALWILTRPAKNLAINLRLGSTLDTENGLREAHMVELRVLKYFF